MSAGGLGEGQLGRGGSGVGGGFWCQCAELVELQAGQSIRDAVIKARYVPDKHMKVICSGHKKQGAHEAHEVSASREARLPHVDYCQVIAVKHEALGGPLMAPNLASHDDGVEFLELD